MNITISDDNGFVLAELTLPDDENLKQRQLDNNIELSNVIVEVIENNFEVSNID